VEERIEVRIHNQVAATRMVSAYRNYHFHDAEVVRTLALSPEETVDGFAHGSGDARVSGRIVDNELAGTPDLGGSATHGVAGRLEHVDGHVLLRLFPIRSGETKAIEVHMLRAVPLRDGVLEYVIPRENLPLGQAMFSLSVDISDDRAIRSLEVAGFGGVARRLGPFHRRVTFEGRGLFLNGDLKIRYRVAAGPSVRLITHRAGKDLGTFLVRVTREPASSGIPPVHGRDIVFLVDTSQAMSGRPLAELKPALIRMLRRLSPSDRFDVIPFADAEAPVFGGLRPATRQARDSAVERIWRLEGRGAKDLGRALGTAFGELREAEPSRPGAVFLLSDGRTHDPEALLAKLRWRKAGIPVYALGLGRFVHRPFLAKLARDTEGLSYVVQGTAETEAEMARCYARMVEPALRVASLRYQGMRAMLEAPERLPAVRPSGELLVLGRYSRIGAGRVQVHTSDRDEVRKLEAPITRSGGNTLLSAIEKLWASRRIDALLEERFGETAGRLGRLQAVSDLARQYNLLTPGHVFWAGPALRAESGRREGPPTLSEIESIQSVPVAGDPVIAVDAPSHARGVVAHFPSGLARRLRYDTMRGRWVARASCRAPSPTAGTRSAWRSRRGRVSPAGAEWSTPSIARRRRSRSSCTRSRGQQAGCASTSIRMSRSRRYSRRSSAASDRLRRSASMRAPASTSGPCPSPRVSRARGSGSASRCTAAATPATSEPSR
jgi:hypothetical protein